MLRRLEDAGSPSSRPSSGCVYFETRGVERLYGGLEAALGERSRRSARRGTRARARGAALRRARRRNVARAGQAIVVDDRTAEFLAPLSLDLLPLPGGTGELRSSAFAASASSRRFRRSRRRAARARRGGGVAARARRSARAGAGEAPAPEIVERWSSPRRWRTS